MTSTACSRSPTKASTARSWAESVSTASATTPCTSRPSGRPRTARTPSSNAEWVFTISSRDASRPWREATSPCRASAARACPSARPRASAARWLAASRSWPRVVRASPVARRRASAAERASPVVARSRWSSSHSAASFRRSAWARSAVPEMEARAFCRAAMRPMSSTWASRACSWRRSASACRALLCARAASAARVSSSSALSSLAERALLSLSRLEALEERAHAALQLLCLARRLLGSRVRLRDLLLVVARLGLVPVDGQVELAQPAPRLLEPGFAFVEGGAARLHARLLGFEGEMGGLLALSLGGEAVAQGGELSFEVQEPSGVDDALDPLHLLAQDAVAAGLAGLALQALELLLHLVDDVVHAEQVRLGGVELELGLAAAGLVLRDAGGLLDEGAPVGGLAGEDLADLPLLDDGVGLAAQARVHEQLVDVAQPAHAAVHEVLGFAVPVEAPAHYALGGAVGAVAVEARNLEVHLRHLQRLAGGAAVEDDVFHGSAAQALRALLPQNPIDGVGDVALAAAVRAHHPGDPALEAQLLLVAKALETHDLDAVQTHLRHETPWTPRCCWPAANLTQGGGGDKGS